jgi:hypothetical protein
VSSRILLAAGFAAVHTAGREYAAEHDVTLENLMSYLPQTNEPGCSAGFAHCLATGVAPQIDLGDPAASAAVCDETDTRYRRYSCIHGFRHAFMRLDREDLTATLELCSALGAAAPDCSQGAFPTTGSPRSAPTTRLHRRRSSTTRVSSAARRPRSSCARAGTAPSSTTGRTSRLTRPPTSSASATASPARSARRASRAA